MEAFLPIYAVKVAGLTAFQVGLLWVVQVVTMIFSKPLMGRTSDRYGRRPVIASGLVLSAMAFGSVPLLRDFHGLLAASALFGLGEAFVTSSATALVADLCQERHFGTAMGAFGTIFDIGHASGPILAGYLLLRFDYLDLRSHRCTVAGFGAGLPLAGAEDGNGWRCPQSLIFSRACLTFWHLQGENPDIINTCYPCQE